jgi:hypothetical protein
MKGTNSGSGSQVAAVPRILRRMSRGRTFLILGVGVFALDEKGLMRCADALDQLRLLP